MPRCHLEHGDSAEECERLALDFPFLFPEISASEEGRARVTRILPDQFIEFSGNLFTPAGETAGRRHDESGQISVSRRDKEVFVLTLGKCPALDKTHTPIGNFAVACMERLHSIIREWPTDEFDVPAVSAWLVLHPTEAACGAETATGVSALKKRLAALKLRASEARVTVREVARLRQEAPRPVQPATAGRKRKFHSAETDAGDFAETQFRKNLEALADERPQTAAEQKEFLARLVKKK